MEYIRTLLSRLNKLGFLLLLFPPQDSTNGFFVLIESVLDDIFQTATLVQRVAVHTDQEDYLADMEDIPNLSDARDEILNRVSNAITQVWVNAVLTRRVYTARLIRILIWIKLRVNGLRIQIN